MTGPHQIEDAVIMTMALMTQARHYETGQHILRTQYYIRELARTLAGHPPYKAILTPGNIKSICKAASMHDIGKIGVPDKILLKSGPLTPEEREEMQRHTVYGRDMLIAAKNGIRGSKDFLRVAREIAYSHHEKWNGAGYPEGRAGESIPLSARLMAVADVYDALISERPYKKALPHAEAMRIIVSGKGTHFDPALVDALEGVQEHMALIAIRFADE